MPPSPASRHRHVVPQRPIRVGMIGAGTVGGGVYELLISRRIRDLLKITKVCVRDLSKPRTFHLEDYTVLTTNVDSILDDPDIDMVVEVMDGGQQPIITRDQRRRRLTEVDENDDDNDDDSNSNLLLLTKRIVETALKRQKFVVTANKSLILEYMDELQQQYFVKNPHFGYEATICGGIPIVQILQSAYAGDTIHRIQAICSGPTNYLLGKMEKAASSSGGAAAYHHNLDLEDIILQNYNHNNNNTHFDDNPTATSTTTATADLLLDDYDTIDIDSHDARAQICILAKLAFGVTAPPAQVPCRGISLLQRVDFEYANLMGCTIKTLAIAQRLHEAREWDGPLCVYVSPVMIPKSHILARHVTTTSKTNVAVAVHSANLGTCGYTGPGAGRFPAANSVVADMIRLAEGRQSVPPFGKYAATSGGSDVLELDHDYTSTFYVRIPFSDGLGIIKRVGELAEHAGVSIHSILQNPIRDRESADFVVTTEEAKVSQVTELCELINREQYFCRAPCMFMPMLVTEEDSPYE